MRGGRNKFGPMYKRDRALRQQVRRQQQHQQLYDHVPCDSNLSSIHSSHRDTPTIADLTSVDLLAIDATPPDIKPDINLLNLMSETGSLTSNMSSHCATGQSPVIVPPPYSSVQDNQSTSDDVPSLLSSSLHSSHKIPLQQSYHPRLDLSSPTETQMAPLHTFSTCSPHIDTLPNKFLPGGAMHLPGGMTFPSTPSVIAKQLPQVSQFIKDLHKSEPNSCEVQHKLMSVTEMALQCHCGLAAVLRHNADHQGALLMQNGQTENSSHALFQLLADICDQSLFILVEWARGACFFSELKVGQSLYIMYCCVAL